MDSDSVNQRDAFLDSTKELRKSIHDKQFEYMEASRNPEKTIGGLRKKNRGTFNSQTGSYE